jgi:predicted transcriptional regulator
VGELLKEGEVFEGTRDELVAVYKELVSSQDKKIAILEQMNSNYERIGTNYENTITAYKNLTNINNGIIERLSRALKLALEVIEEREAYAKSKGLPYDNLQT